MPELPEVECVRLSLSRLVVGRRIASVRVNRADVITGSSDAGALLAGDRVAGVGRHGKQLAIFGEGGGCVSVHLGMSGQLCVVRANHTGPTPKQRMREPAGSPDRGSTGTTLPPHTHVLWRFEGGLGLRFTDPRRFGGLWTFAGVDELYAQRWVHLGPDALCVTPAALYQRLGGTQRGLKAALLDQGVVAGLGNIYVDELLYTARLHPLRPADTLDKSQLPGLVRQMRTLLTGAIARGGSSLRDYVDADSRQGSHQTRHRVYGRAGERCKRRGCGGTIACQQVAGRTTAWCPSCQPLPA